MTNEVEELIIQNCETNNIEYGQRISYLFYKEIWKFILYANKYAYSNLAINFDVIKKDNKYYIDKSDGIRYIMFDNKTKYTWNTYYEGCEPYYINNIFNTNIDLKLLLRLANIDGFNYNYFEEDERFSIFLNIDKYVVMKNINNVLIKNKILKKEK